MRGRGASEALRRHPTFRLSTLSFVLFITLGAVALGTGIWLLFLRRYDRIEPEALRYLLRVAALGGVMSIAAAAVLNEGFSNLLGLDVATITEPGAVPYATLFAFCLFAGFSEEICKSIAAVYSTRWVGDLDEPVDAMIYAMTVALGFAAVENVLYAQTYGNEVLLVRFLWPVPAHMCYAAVWGYGLAKARFIYPEKNRARVMGPYVVAAALLHTAANYGLLVQQTLASLASLSLLIALGYLAHHRLLQLVAESPFLEPGECPTCRNLNSPHALHCFYCGTPLQDTEMFRLCPSGQHRVRAGLSHCPECGLAMPRENRHVPRRVS